ncbi:trimethylamine methyltransferase family protein [Actinomycetota bacterium]
MFLVENEIKMIIDAGIEILEKSGAQVMGEEALEVFKNNNCIVEGKQVRIPRNIIEECLRSTPSRWILYDREGNERLFMGEGKTYYGSADVASRFLDYKTGKVRDFRLNDSRQAVKLMDKLQNIDFVCPFGTPQDISQEITSANAFEGVVSNTTKPIGFMTLDIKNFKSIIEIACAVRKGSDSLRKKPFIMTLIESVSPLSLSEEASLKVLIMAEKGLPFFFSSAPSIGGTSPVTIAGTLAIVVAETLLGLVLAQLKNKGTPLGIGAGIGIIDLKTGTYSLASPETALGMAGFIQICKYLKIPNWSTSVTQSKLPDRQASIEGMLPILLNNMVGADVNWDIGYLESALYTSYEEVVILDETIGMVRRVKQGIEVNDNTIAKDLIIEIGSQGSYLNSPHTFKNFKKQLWFPTLVERLPYDGWVEKGKLSMQDRAKNKIDEILSTDDDKGLSSDIKSKISKILASLGEKKL